MNGGAQAPPRLILFEGIPGSGKTSSAAALHERLTSRGHPSRWYREEDHHHPITPRSGRPPDLAQRAPWWLARWRSLVGAAAAHGDTLILEGTALQSTVRFLFAAEVGLEEMERYVRRFVESVAPLRPR